jgi:hypothetical protein
MAFYPIENRLGLPVNFAQIDSDNYPIGSPVTTNNRLEPGTIVRGEDSGGLGGGEFVYLAGVAGTVIGSVVTYDPNLGTTALAPITTKNLAQPLAIAMAANTSASNFGWYQIEGVATIKKTAVKVNPNVALYLSSTTGRVSSTVASGRQVMTAKSVNAATVASATSTIQAVINRAFAQGQVV